MAVEGETIRAPARTGLVGWARRYRFELALVLPMLLYVVVLTIAPILDTIRISFTSRGDLAFPSMASYQTIFKSEVFQDAVVNTLFVALISLTLEMGVGLAVALALHTRFPGRGFVSTVMLVPLGVPTIVSGAVMLLLFSRSGYLNALFASFYDLLPGDAEFRSINWTSGG